MRTIAEFPLFPQRVLETTTIEMPRGAEIFYFNTDTLSVSALCDAQAPFQPRTFKVFSAGFDVPDGAQYVGSFRNTSRGYVYDMSRVVELPAEVENLPQEAQNAYRVLVRDGFTYAITRDCERPNDPPVYRWNMPADHGGLTFEQMTALFELQEHGLGTFVE